MSRDLSEEIERARSEHRRNRDAYIESAVRLAALEAEAGARAPFEPVRGTLKTMTQNEAALAVVRGASGPIRAREVAAEMRARGFPDVEDKTVNVALGRLVKSKAIRRVGRGVYVAL